MRGCLTEMTLYDQKRNKFIEEDNEEKRVEIQAIEFDWIFYGPAADSFLSRLADSDNDNLFTINTIKVIILFLWNKYFYRIFFIIFMPFCLYITTFCLYVTFIFEQR